MWRACVGVEQARQFAIGYLAHRKEEVALMNELRSEMEQAKQSRAQTEAKVKQIFGEKKPKNEFEDWCTRSLQAMQAQVTLLHLFDWSGLIAFF